MSDFPSLAEVIRQHRIERCSVSSPTQSQQWWRCTACDFESHSFPLKGINWEFLQNEIAADHIADVWRDACTITTADQLDSPELSGWGTLICEIHTPDDDCPESNCWIVPVVWEMVNQMGFMCHNPRHLDESPRLPALLIWLPGWTA